MGNPAENIRPATPELPEVLIATPEGASRRKSGRHYPKIIYDNSSDTDAPLTPEAIDSYSPEQSMP